MQFSKNGWIRHGNASSRFKKRLFCFPYAGGGANAYADWCQMLSPDIDVLTIELPGRGRRFAEKPLKELNSIVDLAVDSMFVYLDRPFSLFGHSMGAIVAFEVAKKLSYSFNLLAQNLFVSGHRAPHVPESHRAIFDLPDDEFISELKILGGTSGEIFENEEILELLMPVLRADFQASECYQVGNHKGLDIPMIAFAGKNDPRVAPDDVLQWSSFTSGQFSFYLLEGDHFFIFPCKENIVQKIKRAIDCQQITHVLRSRDLRPEKTKNSDRPLGTKKINI